MALLDRVEKADHLLKIETPASERLRVVQPFQRPERRVRHQPGGLGSVRLAGAPFGGELAGRSPVDRGKQGLKRSLTVDAAGIPLGTVAAPVNRHDAPLLEPTLDALRVTDAAMTVHLDRGYDTGVTRQRLAARGLEGDIVRRGLPAPITAGLRWVVERTTA